ncbi:MAG: PDZ domain-containing protein [Acidobacteriia bacterium]|nr:PDZ domain-containing protein [Terriglobia bacterium]
MFRLILVLLAGTAILPAADELASEMKTLLGAYAIVEQNAADAPGSEQVFYQGAIPGLLRRLDPHSIFFDPGQFEQLQKLETSTQKGFGTVVSLAPGRIIVLQTVPGTPSAKAGLQPGDEILGINGYIVGRLDLEQLTELLTEARQHPAQLDVKRPGSAGILQVNMTPEELQAPSVDRAFFVAAGIGYVRVANFEESTPKLLHDAIEKLGGEHLRGLVLDLRNNPGGLLTAAQGTASLFLEPGQKILTVRGRNVPEHSETVPEQAKPYRFRLAILVNEKTASASEIVSGAMQDHDRATILGQTTYGKGLVQSIFPLSERSGLALTTALYYTPSGRSIQKPLDASQFELAGATAKLKTKEEFHTDKGRPVQGGGGILPDVVVSPEPLNRLRAVLEATSSFTNFATEYLSKHKITEEFEVTGGVLDDFREYVSERRIQPGLSEWVVERPFLENRLKTEIFNQAFGVEKGDEIEAQRDGAIQRAVEVLGS